MDERLRHLWHPCAQMKDYESFPPLEIVGAEGPYLELANGGRLIDAISSWWCKSLGHCHPRLQAAAQRQMAQFEHVILANTSNRMIRELSARLATLAPGLDRVFFGGDGSTAVEIAVKMSLHAQKLSGASERTHFMALENGYHGETALTLGLSDLGLYKAPYRELHPEVSFLSGVPYVQSMDDPRSQDCAEDWPAIEAQLNAQASRLSAIIVEPIVQGAAGMQLYSADFLRRLRAWTRANSVHLIADEIMTGLGRTGRALACEHAGIVADFVCLSKGLTGGWLPFSAVLMSTPCYELFYDDYETGKAFMHSNTYTGNALGAAIALETLTIYDEEQTFARVADGHAALRQAFTEVADRTGKLHNIRGVGAIVAGDLQLPESMRKKRVGYAVYREAVRRGALLRPIGNSIYWFPPLNTGPEVIAKLAEITADAIEHVLADDG